MPDCGDEEGVRNGRGGLPGALLGVAGGLSWGAPGALLGAVSRALLGNARSGRLAPFRAGGSVGLHLAAQSTGVPSRVAGGQEDAATTRVQCGGSGAARASGRGFALEDARVSGPWWPQATRSRRPSGSAPECSVAAAIEQAEHRGGSAASHFVRAGAGRYSGGGGECGGSLSSGFMMRERTLW